MGNLDAQTLFGAAKHVCRRWNQLAAAFPIDCQVVYRDREIFIREFATYDSSSYLDGDYDKDPAQRAKKQFATPNLEFFVRRRIQTYPAIDSEINPACPIIIDVLPRHQETWMQLSRRIDLNKAITDALVMHFRQPVKFHGHLTVDAAYLFRFPLAKCLPNLKTIVSARPNLSVGYAYRISNVTGSIDILMDCKQLVEPTLDSVILTHPDNPPKLVNLFASLPALRILKISGESCTDFLNLARNNPAFCAAIQNITTLGIEFNTMILPPIYWNDELEPIGQLMRLDKLVLRAKSEMASVKLPGKQLSRVRF